MSETQHAGKRIIDAQGNIAAYEYRDTIIEKQFYADGPSLVTWVISGFGPEGWSEHPTLTAAKAYIDKVKET